MRAAASTPLPQEAMEKWDVVIRLRQDVNAVLEAARAAKRIGKALEAHVSLEAQDDAAGAALEAVRGLDLAEICIVSSCALEPGPEEATQGPGGQFPGPPDWRHRSQRAPNAPGAGCIPSRPTRRACVPGAQGSSPDCPRMLWN